MNHTKNFLFFIFSLFIIPVSYGYVATIDDLYFNETFNYTGTFASQPTWDTFSCTAWGGVCPDVPFNNSNITDGVMHSSYGWQTEHVGASAGLDGRNMWSETGRVVNTTSDKTIFIFDYVQDNPAWDDPDVMLKLWLTVDASNVDFFKFDLNGENSWTVQNRFDGGDGCVHNQNLSYGELHQAVFYIDYSSNVYSFFIDEDCGGCCNQELGTPGTNNRWNGILMTYYSYSLGARVGVDNILAFDGDINVFADVPFGCQFPKVFCDEFDYITPMSSTRNWTIFTSEITVDPTYIPNNNMLDFTGNTELRAYHTVAPFEMGWIIESSDVGTTTIDSGVYASRFTSEMDLNMSIYEFNYLTSDNRWGREIYELEAETVSGSGNVTLNHTFYYEVSEVFTEYTSEVESQDTSFATEEIDFSEDKKFLINLSILEFSNGDIVQIRFNTTEKSIGDLLYLTDKNDFIQYGAMNISKEMNWSNVSLINIAVSTQEIYIHGRNNLDPNTFFNFDVVEVVPFSSETPQSVEWKYRNSTTGGFTSLTETRTAGKWINLKIVTNWAQRELMPFNSTFETDEVIVYINDSEIGRWFGFIEDDTQNQNRHLITKSPASGFEIDNYFVYVGSDKDTDTLDITQTIPVVEDTTTTTTTGEGSGDFASAIETIWSDMGIHSNLSRILVSLFIIFVVIMLLIAMFLHNNKDPNIGVIGVVVFITMIGLVYIRLMPLWIPVIIIILTAGIGALGFAKTMQSGG